MASPRAILLLLMLLALLLVPLVAAGSSDSGGSQGTSGRRGLNEERLAGVCDAPDCGSCFRRGAECGWCGASHLCLPVADADICERGWSKDMCFASCADAPEVLHDVAGMIQVGGQPPRTAYYLPNEMCLFEIYPLPESGPGAPAGSQRSTVIRLQFEYVDLGPEDSIDIFANGPEGQKILTVTGQGVGVVNRVIASRSDFLVLRLNASGARSGTGFRLYYRVDSSPLDLYLISAIVVTSILTCILCSCCCNSTLSMLAGHSGRGGLGAHGGVANTGRRRALSAREKARLPVTAFDAADARFAEHRECCICLSAFEPADPVRELPTCGHLFHAACIDAWFDVNGTCPLCKADVKLKLAAGERDEEEQGGGAGHRGRMARRAWWALRRRFLWPPMRGQHDQHQHDQQQEPGPDRERRPENGALDRVAASLALPFRIWGRWPVPLRNGGTDDADARPVAEQAPGGGEQELQVIFHEVDVADGEGTLTVASSFASQPPEARADASAAVVTVHHNESSADPPRARGGFLSSFLAWDTGPGAAEAETKMEQEEAGLRR